MTRSEAKRRMVQVNHLHIAAKILKDLGKASLARKVLTEADDLLATVPEALR